MNTRTHNKLQSAHLGTSELGIGKLGAGSRTGELGFTLIELMVAMMAGLIAIMSTYALAAASARHFHEQQRVAQSQTALRLAMTQLRRDIQRAGFLGVGNSNTAQTCLNPVQRVAAIDTFVRQDPTSTAWLPNAGENGVSADRIIFTGNYATSDSYLSVGLNATGSEIFLAPNWQSFQRSFGVPFSADAFDAAFAAGRIIRIRNQQGMNFFVRSLAPVSGNMSIRFTPALPIGGSCVVGLASGASVAPLSRIEYLVTDLSRDGSGEGANLAPQGGAVDEGNEFLGRSPVQLVRRELDFGTGDPIAGSTRVVLEYVADFELGFVADMAPIGVANPQIRRLDMTNPADVSVVTNQPERIRSIIVRLSDRAPEQDPRFAWVARADGAPLTRYRVNSNLPGAARVRTITTEISLPNVR